MAAMVAETGRAHLGASGFSSLGAVVGATKGDEVARLRAIMPEQILLLPGFGAQGAGVEDVRAAFGPSGRGAIVTASRSVIYAFEEDGDDWQAAVAAAARSFAAAVAEVAGAGAA
jgi:orotidine-5'-phosphate decarboxylase